MEGNDGGGLEHAAHLMDNLILCHLEGFDKALNARIVSVEREAIGEDGENQGMEEATPVREVQASNRVPQEVKGTGGGAGSIGHDGNVM